ncbi:unnamed protein product [Urochloa humidicola]
MHLGPRIDPISGPRVLAGLIHTALRHCRCTCRTVSTGTGSSQSHGEWIYRHWAFATTYASSPLVFLVY